MSDTTIYQKLLTIRRQQGAGFILLLDPEKLAFQQIAGNVAAARAAGVDAFFVGGTLLVGDRYDDIIGEIKQAAGEVPVILFPGSLYQISARADAILFLSVVSGRNPEHLIGNQVLAAPLIHRLQLETISCAYMLIDSGGLTSAQFASNSLPIPRDKPGIALAHALAARYLGMQIVYLEAGSGAKFSVAEEMIALVGARCGLPVIVGGGIRTPEEAAGKVRAGADFVVVGNFFETPGSYDRMESFARAVHEAERQITDRD